MLTGRKKASEGINYIELGIHLKNTNDKLLGKESEEIDKLLNKEMKWQEGLANKEF